MKKKSGLLLVAVTLVIVCIAVVIFKGNGKDVENEGQKETENVAANVQEDAEENKDTISGDVTVIGAGESLIIPASEVTEDASFIPVQVDDVLMEIIAVRGSDGSIRTAFNTCQVCYSSGRGYFEQEDNAFVCQNCGNRFTVDNIEVQSGGCNPWPIFEENKIVTEDSIEITYDFLVEFKSVFANWK